ncbi:MAG TPA: phosphatase PAP2 family protein [Actinomycetes bacterium]|nr:phosphatase PAP2 family protein [Actinomycetes bacterium]
MTPESRSWPATLGLLAGAWAAVAAVVVAWGWVLTNHLEGSIGAVDDDLARQITDERTPILTDAAEIGTYLGETRVGGIVVALAAVVFALWKRTWLPIVFVAIVEAGLGGIYRLGIHVDPRDRPPVQSLDTGLDPQHSFPSGHVGTAMAIFLVLLSLVFAYTRASRGWGMLLVVVPLACLAARLYQGAHHLSDVLTSVVYAAAWIGIVARLVFGQRVANPSSTVSA